MIELTQEMIDTFWTGGGAASGGTERGLKAVLALIDPVPHDVRVITDKNGEDDYYRLADGGNVWRHECGCCFSTFAKLQVTVGPMTW